MGENFFVNVIKLKIWGRRDDPASCEWMVTAIGAACKRGKGGCDYRQKRRGPWEGSRGKGTQKEKTLHWSWPQSRHEAGHARETAPDSRKGRKKGFSSEPPDSTHSQLKQEEKRETIYLFPSKVEAPSPGALDCASSQGLGNRNRSQMLWEANMSGMSGLLSWPLPSAQMPSFPVLQNWKYDAEKVHVWALPAQRQQKWSV